MTRPADPDRAVPAAGGLPARRPLPGAAAAAAVALIAAAIGLRAAPSAAHAVYIFAWAEGDRICTDSYFSRKSPVRGGEVIMSSADGTELARAGTDDEGDVCFPRPPVEGDLVFAVLAGQGHRAEFTLRAADMPPPVAAPAAPDPVAPASAPSDSAGPPSPETAPPAAASDPADKASRSAGPTPDLEGFREVVRQELAAQLGPINRRLTMEEADDAPTLKNVIGGLGWVFGIFGVAFWITGRKSRSKRAA